MTESASLSQELQESGVELPDGGWSGKGEGSPDQQLKESTGFLLGKPGIPGGVRLAQRWQDTGVKVPSGEHVTSGQKSLASEYCRTGAGHLAEGQWETKKEFLWGEERKKGTQFLWGVQQGPDVQTLCVDPWRMIEVMNIRPPCPAAGPVFKERRKDSIEGHSLQLAKQIQETSTHAKRPSVFVTIRHIPRKHISSDSGTDVDINDKAIRNNA